MKEILLILQFCIGADVFEIDKEAMQRVVGIPAYGVYLHGSIFIREDLEPIFKQSVYIHECVHHKQEQERGIAKDQAEWLRRECEAEMVQRSFLGPLGKGIVGQCNYGAQ